MHSNTRKLIILLWLIFMVSLLFANPTDQERQIEPLIMKIPLGDVPFNLRGEYAFPSMNQSLHLTSSLGKAVRTSAERYLEPHIGKWGTLAAVLLWEGLTIGQSHHLHEGWHQAVLTNQGISSVLGTSKYSGVGYVYAVDDEDLIQLKQDSPEDLVRLSAAGVEAHLELLRTSRLDYFFSGRNITYSLPNWWFNSSMESIYMLLCLYGDNPSENRALELKETRIYDRDAIGLDFNAWVYDLHRPDEAYTERGVHRSGEGIDRYIDLDELTSQEVDYLRLQSYLSFINLLSPQLFGIQSFQGSHPMNGQPFQWNGALAHYPTSFGCSVDLQWMLQHKDVNMELIYHNYINRDSYFPGLELSIIRYPIDIRWSTFYLTGTLAGWLQPESHSFSTSQYTPGGLVSMEIALPVWRETMELYSSLDLKSQGWYAGMESLGSDWRWNMGVNLLW